MKGFSPMGRPGGPAGSSFPAQNGYSSRRERYKAGVPNTPRPHNNKSKKSFTGTIAGLGRPKNPSPVTGPVYRQGPQGPGGARFNAVRVPSRAQTRANPPPATNRKPSLIGSIVGKAKRLGAFFGLGR
jgi:hypothetical protein